MCNQGDGNRSATEPKTASTNGRVAGHARVEHVVDERLDADRATRVVGVGELGVGGEGGEAVPRQVDLRHDDDARFAGCPDPCGDLVRS